MKLKKSTSLKLKIAALLASLWVGLPAHMANADENETPTSTTDLPKLDIVDSFNTLGVLYEELDARKKAVQDGSHSQSEYDIFESALTRKKEALFEIAPSSMQPSRQMSQQEVDAISHACEATSIAACGVDLTPTSGLLGSNTEEQLPLPKLVMLINVNVIKVNKADESTEFVDIDPCTLSIELDYENYDYYVSAANVPAGEFSNAKLWFPTSDGRGINKELELKPGNAAIHVNPELFETWICAGTEFIVDAGSLVGETGMYVGGGSGSYWFYNQELSRGFRQNYTFKTTDKRAYGLKAQLIGGSNASVSSTKSFLIGTSFDKIAKSYEGDFTAVSADASYGNAGFGKGVFWGGGWVGKSFYFSVSVSLPVSAGEYVMNYTKNGGPWISFGDSFNRN
ncbi:MAG: hypothetical protein JXR76_16655 [Deltaproteobacteria bacterium]|nr:hypothetical protein [Deltaproteobacteria bacterium]